MTIRLLPATTDDDLAVLLEIRNQVDPLPMTLEAFRAVRAVALGLANLNAEVDGEVAGAGSVGWSAMGLEARTAFIEIWVLSEHRGRGVGSALLAALSELPRQAAMSHLRAFVVEGDEASLRFAGRRGFELHGRGQTGTLTLPVRSDSMTAAPNGVTTTTLADRPDLTRSVYDLAMLVRPEIPTLRAEPIPSFEAWSAVVVDDPGYSPGLSPLALDGETLVGSLEVYDNGDGSAEIGMMAVAPSARRRGIARHLKQELARRATELGFTRIETFNDGSNERIRRLNVELGYVYSPVMLGLKGPIPDGPS